MIDWHVLEFWKPFRLDWINASFFIIAITMVYAAHRLTMNKHKGDKDQK